MEFQKRALGAKATTAPRTFHLSRKMLGTLLGGAILLAFGILGVQEYYFRQALAAPHEGSSDLKLFEITSGSTLGQISAELLAEKFIDSRWAFEKHVKRKD